MPEIEYDTSTSGSHCDVPSEIAKDFGFHMRCNGMKIGDITTIVEDGGTPTISRIPIEEGNHKIFETVKSWFAAKGIEPTKHDDLSGHIAWEYDD